MKNLLTTIVFLYSSFLFSQILTVNSGSSISIASGSSVTLGGLEIAPSDTYVISGDNALSRSASAITAGDNSSVSRVYSITALLSGFTGTLTFSYLDGELNGIAEGDLVLELQSDDDSWTSYTGTVDETNNTVSYTFTDAVSFKAVTASAAGATLTIEDLSSATRSIYVYPNPTANRVYIQGENITKAALFDLMGRRVRITNQDQIDLSNISSGSYILQVTTQNNSTLTFKIIKK
ncbi:T9SS type A sorting domain-containing protein [Flavobacteriaceae bacterium]|nr:T9SS type A sorting domain-containing protein [Flavobacteriaceae bacterium]MDC0571357.1 T9SS type A sorting domain-containing protein [Flavobacteriaceae bacterium]